MRKDAILVWVTGDKQIRRRVRIKAAQAGIHGQDFLRLAIDLVIDQIPASFFVDGGRHCIQLDAQEIQTQLNELYALKRPNANGKG